MVPDIELNHWGLHSWGTGLHLKITLFFQTLAQVWFYTAACLLQLKSQQVTFPSQQSCYMQEFWWLISISAGPSWELIKTEVILDTRRVYWCHTICKQQKAWGEAAAAEVPPWGGSHQHSGNFLELGVRCLCFVQLAAPAPSPPQQPPHPLSSLYLPLVFLPAHANPTPLIHFLLPKTRFYWLPIPPWQNRKHLLPLDL